MNFQNNLGIRSEEINVLNKVFSKVFANFYIRMSGCLDGQASSQCHGNTCMINFS